MTLFSFEMSQSIQSELAAIQPRRGTSNQVGIYACWAPTSRATPNDLPCHEDGVAYHERSLGHRTDERDVESSARLQEGESGLRGAVRRTFPADNIARVWT